jgi:hypothetical protein
MTRKITLLPIAMLSLLLIPLAAMQFSDQVNWSAGDFVVMGLLLLLLGFGLRYILRRAGSAQTKIALIALSILAFLLIWAELAVGIFGTPFAGS